MTVQNAPRHVHVVSHGPHCLDGVTAAVVVTRFHTDATVDVRFSSNEAIDETLLNLRCDPADDEHEIWITDISWTSPEVDRHLQALLDRGVRIYWIDHHRTAIERQRNGEIGVRPTETVLSERYAASRLTFDYLGQRFPDLAVAAGLARLVAMADDNDRWLHRIPGSRELALTVSAMSGVAAYEDLLQSNDDVTYSPRMREAAGRIAEELRHSSALAERTRKTRKVEGATVISALCDGYASEIGDHWGKEGGNRIFALFDVRTMSISLRRSPDCDVDLSQLARRLGGGGHPAAAGCRPLELQTGIADAVADVVCGGLQGREPS
ncbi:MAG: hypothetical protein HY270_14855 [Deltaproteobacteria bacterium]|nr:hypothetical protein [Deltaproteobacteria bacterium]